MEPGLDGHLRPLCRAVDPCSLAAGVRLSGLLPPLVRVFDLHIWPLHLVAGLWGCLVGWMLLSILNRFSRRAGRTMIIAGGFVGAAVSSVLFFPLVVLF